jgi:hypothetical protein
MRSDRLYIDVGKRSAQFSKVFHRLNLRHTSGGVVAFVTTSISSMMGTFPNPAKAFTMSQCFEMLAL